MPDWTFDGFGPQFDAHARQHLPHYETAYDVIGHVCQFVLPDGGVIADLGCSTGQSVESVAAALPGRRFEAHLYDVDQSMLDLAAKRLEPLVNVTYGSTHRRDLTSEALEHDSADVTLLLWTLQFLSPSTWVTVLERARQASTVDGLLLVGAKTRLSDARWQEIADGALADWKFTHGVTADEALAKARSLRGAMNVVPVGRLFDAITTAGWCSPAILFRWHAWVVIGAWAEPLHESASPDR